MRPVDVVVDLGVGALVALRHRVVAVLRHRDDLAGARLHGHGGVAGTGRIAHGHPVLDGLVRLRLDIRVDRRLDREAAALQELQALLLRLAERIVVLDDALDVVAEIGHVARGRAAVGGRVEVQVQVGLLRLLVLRIIDVAVRVHEAQDDVAALESLLREALRIVGGRVLDDARQHRRLLDVELGRRDAPVLLRRGLDAVDVGRAGVVVDVEVPVEDVVLAVFVLHRQCQLRLAQLAGVARRAVRLLRRFDALDVLHRVRILRQHVLHVLLGQGRSALRGVRQQVVHDGAGDALEVHAGVLVEAVVLDCDGRVLHLLGDVVELDLLAVLPVEVRDERAISGDHARLLGQRSLIELRRKCLEHLDGTVAGGRRHAHGRDRESGGHDPRDAADGDELDERADLGRLVGRGHHGRDSIATVNEQVSVAVESPHSPLSLGLSDPPPPG